MAESAEAAASASPDPNPICVIRPRREAFEHGLLQIPKLIFADPVQTLTDLKQKFSSETRVNADALADSLQIPSDHARLVLDSLASVLHYESDPLVTAKAGEVESVGANLYDVLLFLYIQNYKKLLPRTHKDSPVVADVWPSTSAFDGFLSVMSPLQLARSNSRKMPSQADEEAHQLSYIQKHLSNMISLLAEPGDGEGEEPMVMTMERFEHLGLLFRFEQKGAEGAILSQSPPLFANSDPAVPVAASGINDWLAESIAYSLEQITDGALAKEPQSPLEQDVAMADASGNSAKATRSAGPTYIEGISNSSVVKQASDLQSSSVKVLNCSDSVIYILAPLRYATIYGCSDATIVLGAVGKAVRVEHCERVHVISVAKRVCIANCRDCIFYLGVNQKPLIVGNNHNLQVAPYNTYYPQLEEHMKEVGIETSINMWDEPLALGIIDPHVSSSLPAGVTDAQAETATRLDPDQFTNFLIPNWFGGDSPDSTKDNPFPLPEKYMASQERNKNNLGEIKQLLGELSLQENQRREFSSAMHVYFKDWLYASGNIRQLYYLQGE